MHETSHGNRAFILALQRGIWWLSHLWFGLALLLPLTMLLLGILAPSLQRDGRENEATAVYDFMRVQNHQLPQRSYFLFGEAAAIGSYDVQELQAYGADPAELESFRGNPQIGYKMALNQRMIAIFAAALLAALGWLAFRGRPALPWWGLLLLALPMLIDALTLLLTEAGVVAWRMDNTWARLLWGEADADFYTGDTIGVLNWWLRTLTGILFGAGLTLYLLTRFDAYFRRLRSVLGPRMRRRE